jgi:DNA-binding NtrC family response regulator
MRILIIDDEENIRRITVVVLEAARILGITRDTLHRKKKEISRAPHGQDG